MLTFFDFFDPFFFLADIVPFFLVKRFDLNSPSCVQNFECVPQVVEQLVGAGVERCGFVVESAFVKLGRFQSPFDDSVGEPVP
jgi:hypothetical protein